VEQTDAQAQIAVDFGGVDIGSADQIHPALPEQEAVGLPVQITGSQGCSVQRFPQHIVKEADVPVQIPVIAPGVTKARSVTLRLGSL
jgi:hypothetical protein